MVRLRPPSRLVVATLAAIAVVGVAGGVVAVTRSDSTGGDHPAPGQTSAPSSTASVRVIGLRHGRLPWDRPATLVVTSGSLSTVSVVSVDGNPVTGVLSADGSRWSSTSRLLPKT